MDEVKFWMKCGLKWFWNHNPECNCGAIDDDDSMRSWHYWNGKEWCLATRFWYEKLDIHSLDALFKWAVPKISHPVITIYFDHNVKEWYCKIIIAESPWEVGSFNIDPAVALAETINKALEIE